MPCNNTPAPLNVGASKQTKSGWLALTSGLITGGLQILNGSALTGGANGAVLTSDANGNATWTTLPNTSSPLLTNIGTVTWTETINQTGSYFGCGPVTGSATCTSGVGANPYPLPGWNWNTGAISCPSGYAMLTINTSDSYTNLGGTSLQETIGKKGYCVAFQ